VIDSVLTLISVKMHLFHDSMNELIPDSFIREINHLLSLLLVYLLFVTLII